MFYIKNIKNVHYYLNNPLRTFVPQSLALRFLFLEHLISTPAFLKEAGVFHSRLLWPSAQRRENRVPFTSPPSGSWDSSHFRGIRTGRAWHKRSINHKGQNIIEYAIVIALVSAAMIAMSTYVYRSAQATQKVVEEEFRNE